jgi:hypothetical protein
MSLEVRAVLICDGCGARIESDVEHRSTYAKSAVWEAQRFATRDGWTTVNRGRWHTETHWCKNCSDKPMKPVPRKRNDLDTSGPE